MRYLLDEMFDREVSRALDVLAQANGDHFSHILDLVPHADDEDIPRICADHGVGVLVSVNHKDFGAKKALYQTLIDEGVHVAVCRPKKQVFFTETQLAFVVTAYRPMRRMLLDAETKDQRILMRINHSGVVARSLDELVAEFSQGKHLP